MAFSDRLDRESGLTVRYQSDGAPTSLALATASTPVAVNNLADLVGREVDFVYTKDDAVNGSLYTCQASGPAVIMLSATIAHTQAAAVVRAQIQRDTGGVWTTVGEDYRVASVPADTTTLYVVHREDSVQGADPDRSIVGTRYRITFESDVAADSAEIYSLTVHIRRPAANRSLAS